MSIFWKFEVVRKIASGGSLFQEIPQLYFFAIKNIILGNSDLFTVVEHAIKLIINRAPQLNQINHVCIKLWNLKYTKTFFLNSVTKFQRKSILRDRQYKVVLQVQSNHILEKIWFRIYSILTEMRQTKIFLGDHTSSTVYKKRQINAYWPGSME